jgi:hypothetical protein
MVILKLDELESRLLLNGSRFAFGPPPPHPSTAGTDSVRSADISKLDHSYRDHDDAHGRDGSGWNGPTTAKIPGDAHDRFDRRDPEAFHWQPAQDRRDPGPPRAEPLQPDNHSPEKTEPGPPVVTSPATPLVISLPRGTQASQTTSTPAPQQSADNGSQNGTEASQTNTPAPRQPARNLPRNDVETFGTGGDNPKPVRSNSTVTSAASSQSSTNDREVVGPAGSGPGTSSGQPNPQAPPRPDIASNGRITGPADSAGQPRPQGPAEGFAATPEPARGEVPTAGGPVLPSPPRLAATRTGPARDGEQAEERSVLLPSPLISGALTALPPLDLAAVRRSMQQFLEEIDGMGRGLAVDQDGTGLLLGIIAGGAAVAACEIARRQWRRPDGRLAGDDHRTLGFTPEPHFAE